MAECSVSTSFSRSQVNDSVTTAELVREKRVMSRGRNRGGWGESGEAGIHLGCHYSRIRNDGVFCHFNYL